MVLMAIQELLQQILPRALNAGFALYDARRARKNHGERSAELRELGEKLAATGLEQPLQPKAGNPGNWLEPFDFRGLKFREHSEGIGIQVYDPQDRRWYDVAASNRRSLEKNFAEVPDVAKSGKAREHLGTIHFPIPVQKHPPISSNLNRVALASSAETKKELKRRLGKELYRAELDLGAKLRIAGAPCDCLDSKHTLGIEAAAEELISHEPHNPVYSEIIDWIRVNQPKLTPQAITSGKYDQEYLEMAAQFRDFRKRVMGTEPEAPQEETTIEHAKREEI